LSKKFEIATIYGSLIGFVSTLFMGLVFYNEAILGRGVLYLEPNRLIASVELVMVVVGALLNGFLMIALVVGARPAKTAALTETDEETIAVGAPDKRLFA
jgi:hypothetical protein